MNIEDIKVGETYNVRMQLVYIDEDGDYCFNMETKSYIYRLFNKKDVETCVFPIISSDNITKNTETAPKYDPNRMFRKGDKAKTRIINGRENQKMPLNVIFTVVGDEDEYGAVPVEYMSPSRGLLTSTTVHAVWLELVTPVEELEPYYVEDGGLSVMVNSRINERVVCCSFHKNVHPNAKAAAEAECARLNAEYRKEKE